MSSSSSSSTNVSTDSQLYELAIPDADNTLGGIKDDTQPEHPSVIGHLGKITDEYSLYNTYTRTIYI